MNAEKKFRYLSIVILFMFIIAFFFEDVYFNNKLPFSLFGIVTLMLVLIILEIYFRIQHNIDSKFNKLQDLINSQTNFKRELFNVKNDFEYKLLNFRYDIIRKLDEINGKIDSLSKKSSKTK